MSLVREDIGIILTYFDTCQSSGVFFSFLQEAWYMTIIDFTDERNGMIFN